MDWNNIEQLLEKYYDGTSTTEEEQTIKAAFGQGNIPTHLQADAQLMGYLNKATTEQLEQSFVPPTSSGKTVPLKPKRTNISLIIRQFTAAAVILIAGFFISKQLFPEKAACDTKILATINNQEICDKELAKEEARKALMLISAKLNKGTNELGHLKTMNKPSEITHSEH